MGMFCLAPVLADMTADFYPSWDDPDGSRYAQELIYAANDNIVWLFSVVYILLCVAGLCWVRAFSGKLSAAKRYKVIACVLAGLAVVSGIIVIVWNMSGNVRPIFGKWSSLGGALSLIYIAVSISAALICRRRRAIPRSQLSALLVGASTVSLAASGFFVFIVMRGYVESPYFEGSLLVSYGMFALVLGFVFGILFYRFGFEWRVESGVVLSLSCCGAMFFITPAAMILDVWLRPASSFILESAMLLFGMFASFCALALVWPLVVSFVANKVHPKDLEPKA